MGNYLAAIGHRVGKGNPQPLRHSRGKGSRFSCAYPHDASKVRRSFRAAFQVKPVQAGYQFIAVYAVIGPECYA